MAVRVQGVEEEVTEASKVVADMAVAAVERETWRWCIGRRRLGGGRIGLGGGQDGALDGGGGG